MGFFIYKTKLAFVEFKQNLSTIPIYIILI